MSSLPLTTLLEADGISLRFGGLQALEEVSFTIPSGSIYGVIGPNGAGKTSLFNVLTGLYRADSGRLLFNGRNLINHAPHDIVKAGIARTFQNIRLFASMTALENVMVGRHVRTRTLALGAVLRGPRTRTEEAAIRNRAQALLAYVGLADKAQHAAGALSYGDQRRLEIARALATDPQLLALDEPAAGMNPTETAALQTLLERIRADGTTVLLIEHDVRLVMELCDRITVLDYGRRIAEGEPGEIRLDARVIEAYLGGVPHHHQGQPA